MCGLSQDGLCFIAHLPSGHVLCIVVQIANVAAKRLEVRDDKFLTKGLSEQHNVALHTSANQRKHVVFDLPSLQGPRVKNYRSLVTFDLCLW